MRSEQVLQAHPDPKERLIAAAERVLVAEGLEKASVRAITAEAGLSLSAVNYHFRSRDELVAAVLDELMRRSTEQRFARLRELERDAPGGAAPVRGIMAVLCDAYLPPGDGCQRLLLELMHRHMAGAASPLRRLVARHYDPLARHAIAMLGASLPGVPPATVAWRYVLAMGAVLHAAAVTQHDDRIARLAGGAAGAADPAAFREQVLAFVTDAMTGGAAPGNPATSPRPP